MCYVSHLLLSFPLPLQAHEKHKRQLLGFTQLHEKINENTCFLLLVPSEPKTGTHVCHKDDDASR